MKNVRREDWESLKPSVFGFGINDVNYKVQVKEELPKINGKRKRKVIWNCPYYLDWQEMLRRGFSDRFKNKQPAYKNCTVCEEWKYLSNFIKWVDSQPNRDWINCDLDKDFISMEGKHYSPATCIYIPQSLNVFISKGGEGKYLIGVRPTGNVKNPYSASCKNPFNIGGKSWIGVFKTELQAHKAWQAKKHEYACQLADLQEDPRVAKALRERYAPDKDWTKA